MLKGLKFAYNFVLSQPLYISSMKPSLDRMTIFKLIVHGIDPLVEERENKQKDAKF